LGVEDQDSNPLAPICIGIDQSGVISWPIWMLAGHFAARKNRQIR
jgi:hypothetical protein